MKRTSSRSEASQPQRELSSEYLQGILAELQPDNWKMDYLPEVGLVIQGIEPIDGQHMLLSDELGRDLLAERDAHTATQAELAALRSAAEELARRWETWSEDPAQPLHWREVRAISAQELHDVLARAQKAQP